MTARRKRRHARLNLEKLEVRETPAGVVKLDFDQDTHDFTRIMRFTGDNDSNEVLVQVTPNNNFLVQGANGTTFEVKINGNYINIGDTVDTSLLTTEQFHFPNDGTTKIIANFQGGADIFDYAGYTFGQMPRSFGDVELNMGSGNDTVKLVQATCKNLKITSSFPNAGDDNDTVIIASGGDLDLLGNDGIPDYFQGGIRGNLTIGNAVGNDSITIAATINGSVQSTFTDGSDSFRILGTSRIGKGVTITESSSTTVGTTTFSITENSRIGGDVKLENGKNDAIVTLGAAFITKSFIVNSGDGLSNSSFVLQNSKIGRDVKIRSGSREDLFIGKNLDVGLELNVSTGNGGTGADRLENVKIGTKMDFKFGNGADSLVIQNTSVGRDARIINDFGKDHIEWLGGSVGGHLIYYCGTSGNNGPADPDRFSNLNIGGNLYLDYVHGTTDVVIDQSSVHGPATYSSIGDGVVSITNSTFSNSLTYLGGGGSDALSLNGVSVQGKLAMTAGKGNADFSMTNATVGGDLSVQSNLDFINAQNPTAEFSLYDSKIGGKLSLAGSTRFTLSNIVSGKAIDLRPVSSLSIPMDTITNVRSGNDLIVWYVNPTGVNLGNAVSNLVITNTIVTEDSVIVTRKSGHFEWQGGTVGRDLFVTTGLSSQANPNRIADVTVNVTFRARCSGGRFYIDRCDLLGDAYLLTSATVGTNFAGFFVTDTTIQEGLYFDGSIGLDQLDLTNVSVNGLTWLSMGTGDDEVNITGSGRFGDKVTMKVAGASVPISTGSTQKTTDNDIIRINADDTKDITFLGGLSLDNGTGSDAVTLGQTSGRIFVLTSFAYLGIADDAVFFSPNGNLWFLF